MIQFSAWGTYLLVVPQGRGLIRDRVLISVLRNSKCAKPIVDIDLKRNNNGYCKSNKYTVNIHLINGREF